MIKMIRKSRKSDRKQIKELMTTCFGNIYQYEPYRNLDDRYYLYFIDDKLVAMTGLTGDTDYASLEIDWTCTHPDYRHQGIMKELFQLMLENVDKPIYCSCWRLSSKDKINLYHLMNEFKFKLVIKNKNHWKIPHNCDCTNTINCPFYRGHNCECYEDLYLRQSKYNKVSTKEKPTTY
jgi:N-acetylglutamate synthase-like GNAT family acetyltransferase